MNLSNDRVTRSHVAIVLFAAVNVSPARGQDIPDMNVEAIRAYADGAEAYRAGRNADAIPHFVRAHELDPTFFTPVFMHYVAAGNLGRRAVVDSLRLVLQRNRNRLSPYYQGMFDAIRLQREGRFDAAAAKFHDVAEQFPGTKAAYNYAYVNWVADPMEALNVLGQLDPDNGAVRGYLNYWYRRAEALHTLGEFEAELTSAREAQQRHPDRAAAVTLETNALAALGRVDELEAALTRIEAFPNPNLGAAYGFSGHELMAHGNERAGTNLLERALAWYETEDTRTSNGSEASHAFTLYLLGRSAEARDMYRGLVERAPGNGGYQAWLAITSALAGDRSTAEEILEKVRRGEIGANRSARYAYQIRINAALGNVEASKRALAEYGIRPLWVHRDPVMLRLFGDDPEFRTFLATGRM